MSKTKLTPKQEKFCQCVASGMSYKDSYITAYDTAGKDSTVNAESGKLALREDIQERIKALQKPLIESIKIQGLNERQQQINFILERIEICKMKDDEQSIIRYTEMLNKIYALYKESDQPEKTDTPVSKLDESTLRKLSGIA